MRCCIAGSSITPIIAMRAIANDGNPAVRIAPSHSDPITFSFARTQTAGALYLFRTIAGTPRE